MNAVVDEARRWLGTPYLHQASRRGVGADCLGLICGVWQAVVGALPQEVPAYTRDWGEPEGLEVLWQAARRHLLEKPLDEVAAGDVILFRMREGAIAKHLGIQSAVGRQPRFIHAYERHGVVESPLSAPWERRVVRRFCFPLG